jgi:ABC-2 type transport system ATP-binding protein
VLLLDLIRPTQGRPACWPAPRRDGVALRRRVGYLAGDFVVDARQSGRELLSFLGNLRGGVPRARIDELAGRLDLDLSRKVKALSRRNRRSSVWSRRSCTPPGCWSWTSPQRPGPVPAAGVRRHGG